MSPLEGKWTKVFYLDIKTYSRVCDNNVKKKVGFFKGEWVPVLT